MTDPHQILQQYWGFSSFRPMQEDIINAVLDGRDTVALLPTGGGKSLCFQIPALAKDGICIVVSPLVALMKDQVNRLKEQGVKALSITGGISFSDLQTLLDNARYGSYKFLYLSPERLQQEIVQNAIRGMPVNLIAVDEAHCVSQWGHDFRPAYRNIAQLRTLHPLVPMIALTATATSEVLEDTISNLSMEEPAVFRASFVRENLSYQTLFCEDKNRQLQQWLSSTTGNSIVYVRSRKMAAQVSQQLNALGLQATYYHGGLTPDEKDLRLEQWQKGSHPIMVATNAFGMGIDQAQVRYVVHLQLPDSLESYYQEAGRAGRDGNPAVAAILYHEHDKDLVQQQFIHSLPDVSAIKTIYKHLCNYFQISYGEGEFSEHAFNFTDFCSSYNLAGIPTYNGLTMMDRLGILSLSQEFGRKSTLHFRVNSETLLSYFQKNTQASVIGKTILRMYGGVFETPTQINLDLVAKKTGKRVTDIVTVLQELEQRELVSLKLQQTDAKLTFVLPREDEKTIHPFSREIDGLRQRKKQQVLSVLKYLEDVSLCKSLHLAGYFGDEHASACGICSVCMTKAQGSQTPQWSDQAAKILAVLELGPESSHGLSEKLTFAEADILRTLSLLTDAGKVKIDFRNRYHLA